MTASTQHTHEIARRGLNASGSQIPQSLSNRLGQIVQRDNQLVHHDTLRIASSASVIDVEREPNAAPHSFDLGNAADERVLDSNGFDHGYSRATHGHTPPSLKLRAVSTAGLVRSIKIASSGTSVCLGMVNDFHLNAQEISNTTAPIANPMAILATCRSSFRANISISKLSVAYFWGRRSWEQAYRLQSRARRKSTDTKVALRRNCRSVNSALLPSSYGLSKQQPSLRQSPARGKQSPQPSAQQSGGYPVSSSPPLASSTQCRLKSIANNRSAAWA